VLGSDRLASASVLEGLLDASVVTVEVDLYGEEPLEELLPEEQAALPRARSERRLEFRAGRHCARVALSRLGAPRSPLLPAADRSPLWPAGYVGSITHTRAHRPDRGWCAAAVARATSVRAVGIDGELDEPLEPKLWDRILRPREREWIMARPESERGYWAKLHFSAKEATYKCQYAVTHEFLEFADVEVTVFPDESVFVAVLMRDASALPRGHELRGRYTRRSGVVATAVVLR
jgi:4'-phosphopantetheinyl transferase EntD